MKPKNPELIDEIDVEVVHRQWAADERREISAFIRSYKSKLQHAAAGSTRPAKV